MSEHGDGGPVFPQSMHLSGPFGGLSLRDYFAAKAMQGLVSALDPQTEITNTAALIIASESYTMADAMLTEKEQCHETSNPNT